MDVARSRRVKECVEMNIAHTSKPASFATFPVTLQATFPVTFEKKTEGSIAPLPPQLASEPCQCYVTESGIQAMQSHSAPLTGLSEHL